MSMTAPRVNAAPHFLIPVEAELRRVEEVLHAELSSPVRTAASASSHILDAGGKRLRPSLVALSAHACQRSFDLDRLVKVAASAELIHMATLIHDDVVDGAEFRRGKLTANSFWGNQVSVLTGDYMLAKAFSLLAPESGTRIAQTLSDATIAMAEGEIAQIESRGDTQVSFAFYLSIIRDKTAEFMSACCRIGAIIASGSQSEEAAFADYGLELGLAFQITDDLLDLIGDPAQTGKPVGGDLREGKVTMPIILTLERASQSERAALENIIQADAVSSEEVGFVCKLAESTGAIEDARSAAADYIERAVEHLQTLPASEARDSLEELAWHILRRER